MTNTEKIKNVIEKYSDIVYKIAITRTGSIENAEDVFQEVFIKYSQKNPNFENEEHEKAWFIKVTINLTKNLHNEAWNRKTIPLEDNIKFENKEEEDVFSAVNQLPQNYKTVIYLFYYEGYKVKEISKIMNTREGTIKTWLSRARECLKEKIKGGFENE